MNKLPKSWDGEKMVGIAGLKKSHLLRAFGFTSALVSEVVQRGKVMDQWGEHEGLLYSWCIKWLDELFPDRK